MALKTLASICSQNHKTRFERFWNFEDSIINSPKWNINKIVDTKQLPWYPGNKRKRTTILCISSEFANAWFVTELLKKGSSVDICDENGNNCLHLAAETKHQSQEKIKILLAHDPCLIVKFNKDGFYPLHSSVLAHNHVALSALMDNELCDINMPDNRTQNTALHIAAMNGCLNEVQILLCRRDIGINLKNSDGHTPLHLSAKYEYCKIYEMLRQHKMCDVSVTNDDGFTASEALFVKLIEKSFTSPINELKGFVNDFKVPCVHDKFSKTPLHNACLSRIEAVEKIKYLVKVDSRQLFMRLCNDNSLPVHMAAMNPDSQVLKAILDIDNVDPNAKRKCNKNDRKQQVTPLHISCGYGNSENVKVLLDNRWTEVNIVDGDRNSALHVACKYGRLQAILVMKSDPRCRTDLINRNSKTADELTPHGIRILDISQTGYDFELSELLNKSAYLICDEQKENALHKVCQSGRDARAKAVILIDENTNLLFMFNNQGLTPFPLGNKARKSRFGKLLSSTLSHKYKITRRS